MNIEPKTFWQQAAGRATRNILETHYWASGVAFAAINDSELHNAAMKLALYSISADSLDAVQTFIEEHIAGVR